MTPSKPRLDGTAAVCLVQCCTIWGLGQVSSKAALVEVQPFTQVAVRSLGATILVALWSRARGSALVNRVKHVGTMSPWRQQAPARRP